MKERFQNVTYFICCTVLAFRIASSSVTKAYCQNTASASVDHYRRAGESFRARDYAHAIEECKKAVETQPHFAQAYDLEGRALTALNRYEEAEAVLKEALKQNPKYLDARTNLSFAYYLDKKQELAVREAHAALALNARDVRANLVAGLASYSENEFAEAISCLRRAEPLTGNTPEALVALIRSYLALHDRESAIKRLGQLAHQSELSAADQFDLGQLYDEFGLYQEEASTFARLSDDFPSSFEAKYNLAVADFHLGKTTEARELLEKSLASQPRGEAYDLIAACDERLREIPAAARAYVNAIEVDPYNEDYYLRLAMLTMLAAAHDVGVAELQVGLKRLPKSFRIRWMMGTIEEGHGEPVKAEYWFREAISINPRYNLSWALLALFFARRARLPEAFEVLRVGILQNPDDYLLPYIHGLILIQNQQPGVSTTKEVEALLKHSIALDPNFVESRYHLGRLYLDQGDLNAARVELEKAQAIDRYHYGANLLLNRVYRKLGDTAKAAEAVKLLEEGGNRYIHDRQEPTDESILSLQKAKP